MQRRENTPPEGGLCLKARQWWGFSQTEAHGRSPRSCCTIITKNKLWWSPHSETFGQKKYTRICDHIIIILPNWGKTAPPVGGWIQARGCPFHYNNVMQTSKWGFDVCGVFFFYPQKNNSAEENSICVCDEVLKGSICNVFRLWKLFPGIHSAQAPQLYCYTYGLRIAR